LSTTCRTYQRTLNNLADRRETEVDDQSQRDEDEEAFQTSDIIDAQVRAVAENTDRVLSNTEHLRQMIQERQQRWSMGLFTRRDHPPNPGRVLERWQEESMARQMQTDEESESNWELRVISPTTVSDTDDTISDLFPYSLLFDTRHGETYEQLLEMVDQIGSVHRGLAPSQINRLLPTMKFSDLNSSNSITDCTICLTQYQPSDLIRALPCKHVFHQQCADSWLSMNRTCPVCRFEISEL